MPSAVSIRASKLALCAASFLFLIQAPGKACATEIKLLCAIGLRPMMSELVPEFENREHHRVAVDYQTAGKLVDRIRQGEAADVLIVTAPQLEILARQGRIIEGSKVEISKLGIGLFVRRGAAKPDISSAENFKSALLAAESIGHADPAGGGAVSSYVAGLLGQIDIAESIKPKLRTFPPSNYRSIASSEIEIAFGSVSEILADPEVAFVGPLPAEFQHYTRFAAGLATSSKEAETGRVLIGFLTSPSSIAVAKAKGFEPP